MVFGAYMNGSYKRVSISVIERKSQNMIYSDTCETGARHMRSLRIAWLSTGRDHSGAEKPKCENLQLLTWKASTMTRRKGFSSKC